MKPAYFNEIDEFCAQWLRNLIAAGLIADGDVDTRSIKDVQPDDLRGYTQCHFFAGIGVWSAALRMAGWADDRPVWTGSCPCQPFSGAGKARGFEDPRHLWPDWWRLIRERRPVAVFGEQVASPDGRAWLDLVRSDLEGDSYPVGTVVTPAAGFGAPHGRHRIFFVADSRRSGRDALGPRDDGAEAGARAGRHDADRHRGAGDMADTAGAGPERHRAHGGEGAAAGLQPGPAAGGELGHAASRGLEERSGSSAPRHGRAELDAAHPGDPHRLDDASEQGLALWRHHQDPRGTVGHEGRAAQGPGPVNGFWADAEWVLCRDPQGPRWRPIEPGSFPVADGAFARVGRLRAAGNAISPQQAAAFIAAFMEVRP